MSGDLAAEGDSLHAVCACGHRQDVHYRTLHKRAPDTRCAVVACDCVEFVPYVPDGRDV